MVKRYVPIVLILITVLLLSLSIVLGQFSVGLTLIVTSYNLTGSAQLNNTVYVNGSNVTIQIPLLYGGAGMNNITLEKPSGWYNGSQWYVDEISQAKNVTSDATSLSWEANLSSVTPSMIFQVPPPYIISESVYQTIPFYEKNITINSNNHLINISVNVSINSSYESYVLYWFNSGYWDNYTDTYHLSISNNSAFFYGFSTSDQYFRIQGLCAPNWVCSDWSSCVGVSQSRSCIDTNNCGISQGMPVTSQSCTGGVAAATSDGGGGGRVLPKQNVTKTFEVSPKILRIKLKENEIAKRLITIENTGNTIQKFKITSSFDALLIDESSKVINASRSSSVQIELNAKNLKPGGYSGKIHVTNGEQEKQILILLEAESPRKIVETHLDISPQYSFVKPGDEVIGTITLYNLYTQSVDVDLDYYLKDLDNNIVLHEEEQVHVGYQLSFEKEFQLPSVLPDESYVLSVQATVQNLTSVSGSLLRIEHEVQAPVIEHPVYISTPENNMLYLIILVVIVVVILFVFEIVRFSHPKAQYADAESIKLKGKELEIQKLRERAELERLKIRSEKQKRANVLKEQQLIDKRRVFIDLLHTLGLYRTKEEIERKKLEKEQQAKMKLQLLQKREQERIKQKAARLLEIEKRKAELRKIEFERKKKTEEEKLRNKQASLLAHQKEEDAKHKAELQRKKRLEEEKLRQKESRLGSLQKKEELRRKLELEKQKKIEFERLEKAAEFEKLRLKRESQTKEVMKQRELMQEQKLKENTRREELLRKQKEEQQRAFEREQREKENHKLMEQRLLKRRKRMHGFLHAFGLYRTQEERQKLKFEKKQKAEQSLRIRQITYQEKIEKLLASEKRKKEAQKLEFEKNREAEEERFRLKQIHLIERQKQEDAKHRAELERKKRLEEGSLKEKKSRLEALQRKEELRRKLELEKQKKVEFERLKKASYLEKIKLESEHEKNERSKRNQLMQEQRLKARARADELLKNQKEKEQRLLEKIRHRKEQEMQHGQKKLERRKKMREFLHVLGLFKTKDELELKKLQKEWERKLELKKLDERRKAWLTRQKELELQKLQKEENVEKLKLQRQQQEQLSMEKRNMVEDQKQPGWQSKSRLYKLVDKAQEFNPKAMNIPLRQTTLVLDLINTLVDKAYQDIQGNDLENAYRNYLEIKKLYKKLPAEHKKQVVTKCIELHDILVEKFS